MSNLIVSLKVISSTLTLLLVFLEVQLDSVIYRCTKSEFNTANLDYLTVMHSVQKSLNTSRLLYENRKFMAS